MGKLNIRKGLIFWKWETDTDTYTLKRIAKVSKTDKEDEYEYTFANVDEKYHLVRDNDDNVITETLSNDEYFKMFDQYSSLISQGYLSISNAIIGNMENGKSINDVIMMLFLNSDEASRNGTVFRDPAMVARQAIANISKSTEDITNLKEVGVSLTKLTCPENYSLKDISGCDRILQTNIFNIYRTDNAKDILYLLENNENVDTNSVFKDLYDHAVLTEKRNGFIKDDFNEDSINGYCKNLKVFFEKNNIFIDILSCLGVSKFDVDLSDKKSLNNDDKLTLSVMYGGIRIHRTFIMRYSFEIEMNRIKMKYMLVLDSTDTLYIIAYTEDPSQILKGEYAYISKKNEEMVRHRLREIVDACSKNDVIKN